MHTRDIMTRTVVSATPDTSVLDAAHLMVEGHISALPVVSGGAVVGILSEADLLHRYEIGTARHTTGRSWWWGRLFADRGESWSYIQAHAMKVRDIMTAPVVAIEETMAVGDIAALFESRRIRRAPVLRDGAMVGIVSRSDFVRALVARATIRHDERPRSDEWILRSLLEELGSQRWWRSDRSEVSVTDGIVHISGWIDNEADKLAARVAAENVSSVRRVEDTRAISDPPPNYI